MSTRYDQNKEQNNKIVSGYEESQRSYDYIIPSCGLEDLDVAVFDLFNEQLPLFHTLQGEKLRVPVIFATGERFAILRRKKPITDNTGALILPLVSITRGTIDNTPQKGMANNEMFPEVVARRIADNNVEWRQQKNFEGFNNIKHTTKSQNGSYSLKPQLNNIYETLEIPPVKYFGCTYEITIWSSFTQQMNKLLTSIMSSYTINPGRQLRIESRKGYWFPAFIDSSFSQDTNYSDFTDAERYIKHTLTLNATGYILAPNIEGGKVGLKSIVSAPKISFDVLTSNHLQEPQHVGVRSNDPNAKIFDDIKSESDHQVGQQSGIPAIRSLESLQNNIDNVPVISDNNLNSEDVVGNKNSENKVNKKIFSTDKKGNKIPVVAQNQNLGETVYDQKYAEFIFNISNNDN
tara:strand:+ start:200 stop:1414 length:1215 start_codon:yes stop_codon:yes gene_type:complete